MRQADERFQWGAVVSQEEVYEGQWVSGSSWQEDASSHHQTLVLKILYDH